MSLQFEQHVKQGGDPRNFPDFAALKDELSKLHHPARPDINWQYAENLCLSLFRQNGVELQSAAWYSYIRTQRMGLQGMNEGLSLVHALICHQWQTLWPAQVHLRVEILAQLSERLLQSVRGYQMLYSDLPALYKAESFLSAICNTLETLELKHLSRLERLHNFVQSAAKRLESLESTGNELPSFERCDVASQKPMQSTVPTDNALVYVVRTELKEQSLIPSQGVQQEHKSGLLVGLCSGVLLGAGLLALSLWVWQLSARNTLQEQLAPSFFTAPVLLSESQRVALDPAQLKNQAAWLLTETAEQLEQLERFTPIGAQEHGQGLLKQLQQLLPDNSAASVLHEQWQQQLQLNAIAHADLQAWHTGMEQLAELSAKLNTLDEKRGRYMTVSELKTAVFNIREAFTQKTPIEERLNQLQASSRNGSLAPALLQQTDADFKQLLNRYALIKQGNSYQE
ncbi:MAG: hypothetical protein GXZ10_12470 [Gammaproteobacteria bacterium]|nr:hypothetical protein [Gammaproteobacteria bacterium]